MTNWKLKTLIFITRSYFFRRLINYYNQLTCLTRQWQLNWPSIRWVWSFMSCCQWYMAGFICWHWSEFSDLLFFHDCSRSVLTCSSLPRITSILLLFLSLQGLLGVRYECFVFGNSRDISLSYFSLKYNE